MPFIATISVSGIDSTIQALNKAAAGLKDYRPFLSRVVAPELKKEFEDVWRTRGYGAWSPLAQSTIKQKRRRGYTLAPLVRTGRYRKSSINLRGMRVRRYVLEIRSPVPYAKYHEYGQGRMHRAVFSIVAERMRRELPRLYQDYLRRTHLRELS